MAARIVDSADVDERADHRRRLTRSGISPRFARTPSSAPTASSDAAPTSAAGVAPGRQLQGPELRPGLRAGRLGDGVFIGPAVVLTNDTYPRAVNPDGTPKSAADWERRRRHDRRRRLHRRPGRVRRAGHDRRVGDGGRRRGRHRDVPALRARRRRAGPSDRLGRARPAYGSSTTHDGSVGLPRRPATDIARTTATLTPEIED